MIARIVFALAALVLILPTAHAAGSAEPNDVYVYMGTPVEWKIGELADHYIYNDQQDRKWSVELKPEGKTDEGKPKFLKMMVSGENFAPATVTIDMDMTAQYGTLGVYDFAPQSPVFMISNYSMGAHCCMVAKAVSFTGDKLVPVDVGTFDGSDISVRDLDGDGTYEIESWDQRFYYAFDSYAGSLPARQILKVRDKVEDVTESAEYQNYLIAEVLRSAPDCIGTPAPGVCAGVLGTAAKAGIYQSVAADVGFKQIDDDNKEAAYLDCSADQCGTEMKFWNYREALEFQLDQWGYKTDSGLSDAARRFFGRLAGFSKGFGPSNPQDEIGCAMGPVRFVLDKKAQTVELQGYEYSCRIEKANVLANSAVALGFCGAEGESYSELLSIELKQDTLYMSSILHGSIDPKSVPAVLPACR